MKIVLLKLLICTPLLLGACTYPNEHGTQSAGVKVSGDVDVFGLGVDAGFYTGVHSPVQPQNRGPGMVRPGGGGFGHGGVRGFAGIPVGECNPAGVNIVDYFVDVAVPRNERDWQSKDAEGSVNAGIARCQYRIVAGSDGRTRMILPPQ